MSTAAVTPEVVVGAPASTTPVTLTPAAIAKVREIMATQNPSSCWTADWCGWRWMFGFPVLHVV